MRECPFGLELLRIPDDIGLSYLVCRPISKRKVHRVSTGAPGLSRGHTINLL